MDSEKLERLYNAVKNLVEATELLYELSLNNVQVAGTGYAIDRHVLDAIQQVKVVMYYR